MAAHYSNRNKPYFKGTADEALVLSHASPYSSLPRKSIISCSPLVTFENEEVHKCQGSGPLFNSDATVGWGVWWRSVAVCGGLCHDFLFYAISSASVTHTSSYSLDIDRAVCNWVSATVRDVWANSKSLSLRRSARFKLLISF